MAAPIKQTLAFMSALWALDHALHRASKRMAARLGVTGPQRLVLRMLGSEPTMTAGQVARTLHLDPSTVAGMLARLEANGFIRRSVDRRDARRICLVLTPKGRTAYRRSAGTVEAAIERALGNGSARDLTAAIRAIDRLTAAILRI